MKKGSIPIMALIKTGTAYSMVRNINEYRYEYIKYRGNVDHAQKHPKPKSTSPTPKSMTV